MYYSRTINIGLVFVLLTLLAACSSMNSKVGGMLNLDTDLKLEFIVDSNINPDDNANPSPLFVRMYELKSRQKFDKADFIDLFERDKAVLGDSLIARHKLRRFAPGESREETLLLDANTRYIGLYAEFLQYKNSKFSVVIPVEPHNVIRNSAVVRIVENTIRVTK